MIIPLLDDLQRDGCELVRGAIPADLVKAYLDALDAIYAQDRGDGTVALNDFAGRSGLRLEALFRQPELERRARDYLVRHRVLNGNMMSVAQAGRNAISGLNLHTDGIIQGSRGRTLAMWTTLHPCGVDAPGLAIVRAGEDRVLDHLRGYFPGKKLPGWHSTTEWNSTPAFSEEVITRAFTDVWKPVMQPGDVMLFTDWTIHGSNVRPGMTARRSAAVLRLRSMNLLQSLHYRLRA